MVLLWYFAVLLWGCHGDMLHLTSIPPIPVVTSSVLTSETTSSRGVRMYTSNMTPTIRMEQSWGGEGRGGKGREGGGEGRGGKGEREGEEEGEEGEEGEEDIAGDQEVQTEQ